MGGNVSPVIARGKKNADHSRCGGMGETRDTDNERA